MPTILRIGSLRVVLYSNDHPPPHAHVIGGGGEAVFALNCPHGPVTLRESHGFGATQLRQVVAELEDHVPTLCAAWSAMHGPF